MVDVPKRFKTQNNRTESERMQVVENLNDMVDAIKRLLMTHIRVGPGLEMNASQFGIGINLAAAKGTGGPSIVLLTEDLASGNEAKATTAKEEEITVNEFMGFEGDPIPAGTYVWAHKTKKPGDIEKKWWLLNAAGEPGCGTAETTDCDCQ